MDPDDVEAVDEDIGVESEVFAMDVAGGVDIMGELHGGLL